MAGEFKDYRYPFHVVEAAVKGDAQVIEMIWKDFEPYINTLCARTYQDKYGNVSYMFDQDMKDYMKEQLAMAITHNFDINYGQDKEK